MKCVKLHQFRSLPWLYNICNKILWILLGFLGRSHSGITFNNLTFGLVFLYIFGGRRIKRDETRDPLDKFPSIHGQPRCDSTCRRPSTARRKGRGDLNHLDCNL